MFVHGRQDPDEIVMAIDLATGKVLWQQKYPAPFQKNQYAVKMAKGPNSTPLVLGDRLLTLGGTAVLTAWDTATGRQLWTQGLLKDGRYVEALLRHGRFTACSRWPGGGPGGQRRSRRANRWPSIQRTGAAKWEWRGPGPGYASPVVIDMAGKEQVVTLSNSSIIGVDAKTGKELWSMPVSRRVA